MQQRMNSPGPTAQQPVPGQARRRRRRAGWSRGSAQSSHAPSRAPPEPELMRGARSPSKICFRIPEPRTPRPPSSPYTMYRSAARRRGESSVMRRLARYGKASSTSAKSGLPTRAMPSSTPARGAGRQGRMGAEVKRRTCDAFPLSLSLSLSPLRSRAGGVDLWQGRRRLAAAVRRAHSAGAGGRQVGKGWEAQAPRKVCPPFKAPSLEPWLGCA